MYKRQVLIALVDVLGAAAGALVDGVDDDVEDRLAQQPRPLLTQLSWYFSVLRFLCNFKCTPYNILPVTLIHFSPFCCCSRHYLSVLLYYFIGAYSVYISC